MTILKRWMKRCIRIGYRILFSAKQPGGMPQADYQEPQTGDSIEVSQPLDRDALFFLRLSGLKPQSLDDASIEILYHKMYPEDSTFSHMDQKRAETVAAFLCAGVATRQQMLSELSNRRAKGFKEQSEQSCKPDPDHQRDVSSR